MSCLYLLSFLELYRQHGVHSGVIADKLGQAISYTSFLPNSSHVFYEAGSLHRTWYIVSVIMSYRSVWFTLAASAKASVSVTWKVRPCNITKRPEPTSRFLSCPSLASVGADLVRIWDG
ncbi:hypothetical protein BDV11DRAFT_193061 [Aspergillus similis]